MRRTKRTNKDGSSVATYSLHATSGILRRAIQSPRSSRILGAKFQWAGRRSRGLYIAMSRVLSPEDQIAAEMGVALGSISIGSDKSLGRAWALDQIWTKLGIRSALEELLRDMQSEAPVYRALFAITANHALAPSSRLAMED